MKLIPIDPNNLCKDYVLAYSVSEKKLIGKLANMNGDVVCVSHETSLSNISHYLPLDEIEPESEKKRTYYLYASLKGSNSINHVLGSRTAILSRVKNKPIDDDFSNWFLEIRKEFSEQNNLSIDDVIITSFSCTETT